MAAMKWAAKRVKESPAARPGSGFVSQGFAWETPVGVSPALRSASRGESVLRPGTHRMVHPYWVIDYCFHSGEEYRVDAGGSWRERMGWLARRAQTAHLYPANTEYWERVVEGPVMRRSASLLFSVAGSELFERMIDKKHGYAEIEDPAGEIGRLMREAAGVGHARGAAGFWEAQGVLCRLLDMLLGSAWVQGPVYRHEPGAREPADLAGRVDAYIRESLPGRLSLGEIAKAMKVSASALSHGYKRQRGKAVMAAAMEARLEMAKPLLLQGQRLKTVAGNLGFSDAFHLSKQFKRRMGVSPREFVMGKVGG